MTSKTSWPLGATKTKIVRGQLVAKSLVNSGAHR